MGLGANPPAHGLQYLDGVLLLSAGMTEVRGHDHGPCRGTRPDQLWQLVVPLLPTPPRPPYGGRRRTVSDRNCLAAMIFMARTSTPWRLLPARELGCGSPATVWRRLAEWARAGIFDALHLGVLQPAPERSSRSLEPQTSMSTDPMISASSWSVVYWPGRGGGADQGRSAR
jgi:transposase